MIESAHPHELVLVGLSHQTASLEVREKCSVAKGGLAKRLIDIKAAAGAAELLILSTCNRTEILGVGPDGVALEQELRGSFPVEARSALYAHQGAEAVFHVFSVCGGLRSMVVGEAEIQGQLKDAWRAAQDAAASGPVIDSVVQQALHAGKRLRTETELGSGTVSVVGAAVELITKVHGDLSACSVFVIGTGNTGLLLARQLRTRGARRLFFANRTAERAQDIAETAGDAVVPFGRIHAAAAEHDVVVTCVESPEHLLRAADLAALRWPKRDLPKIFVDLSVPRAIDPAVSGLHDAFLFDLDALQSVVGRHLGQRLSEVEHAEQIVIDEARNFLGAKLTPSEAALERSWRRYREQHR